MAGTELTVLTLEECVVLLAQGGLGRLGVSVAAMPEIFPVAFCFSEGDILFRTGTRTRLHSATQGTVVAFEIDAYDPDERSGWSVLVTGSCSEEQDPNRIADARQRLSEGWVPGDQDHIVRITPYKISGRRICQAR